MYDYVERAISEKQAGFKPEIAQRTNYLQQDRL